MIYMIISDIYHMCIYIYICVSVINKKRIQFTNLANQQNNPHVSLLNQYKSISMCSFPKLNAASPSSIPPMAPLVLGPLYIVLCNHKLG